jgi:hypothetical protein
MYTNYTFIEQIVKYFYIYSKDVHVTWKANYTTILETNWILYMDKIKHVLIINKLWNWQLIAGVYLHIGL